MKCCRNLLFRRSLCMLLFFSVLLFLAPDVRAAALSGTCGREGDNLSWIMDENGVLTITGKGEMMDFRENSTRPWPVALVSSLVLTEGVTSIGDFAFFGCRRLESVSFPETLNFIGTRAFFFCSHLRSIELPDSVTALGSNPFAHCTALEYIAVSSGNPVFTVTNGALLSLSDARMIWYPNGSVNTEFVIPDGIRIIDDYAFSFCRSLHSVELPDTLVSIGARAFDGCASLETVILPTGLEEIGNQAFSNCSGLSALTIPEGVTALGQYTFARCSKLSSVVISDSVTAIDATAFYCCFSLQFFVGKGSAAEHFCLENGLLYDLV